MRAQGTHAMLPMPNHDEAARQMFTAALRREVTVDMAAGNRLVFERRVEPEFRRTHGRAPRDRHEVRKAMARDPYAQFSSAMRCTYQELLWDSVSDSIERQLPSLIDTAKKFGQRPKKGSLALDPSVAVPRYLNAVDIHLMPGNYEVERAANDVFAGALYDRGVYLRVLGNRGRFGEAYGASLGEVIKKQFPGFKPRRILDEGCAVGGSTMGIVDSFPAAEVYAIDVAAPMLRYAHGRAESLGRRIHFSQQNAEHTNFLDGHFDLIFSFALFHETSTKACQNILNEAYRLLAPGGILACLDLPPWKSVTPFEAASMDWDTHFNAEPFMGTLGELDRPTILTKAGFRRDQMIDIKVPGVSFPAFGARK